MNKLSYQLYKISSLIFSSLSEGKIKEIIRNLNSELKKSNFNSKEEFYKSLKIINDKDFIDNYLDVYDPSQKKIYSIWIMRQFFNDSLNQSNPKEDLIIIKENLEKFIQYSKKEKWKKEFSTNINDYTKSKLAQTLRNFEDIKEENILDKIKDLNGAKNLGKHGPYIIIEITTSEASEIICKNSEWCVRHKETAQKYLNDGILYYLYDINKDKKDPEQQLLVHYESNQYMNRNDKRLIPDKIKEVLRYLLPLTHPEVKIEDDTIWIDFSKKLPPLKYFKHIKAIGPPIYKWDLDLTYSKVESLPDRLKVGGDLNLYKSKIESLPNNLEVGGNLKLSNLKITSLPDGLKVGGNLYISNTEITSLPNGLEVGRDLNLSYTKIESLSNGLKVGGNLNLRGAEITSLPNGLEVGWDLNLKNTKIESLPKDLKIKNSLDLGGTPIKSLPDNLIVYGNLYLDHSKIESLPKDLKVGGDLILSYTKIKLLPNDLKVKGKIYKDF